jgi:hypothetical protein
LQDGLGIVVVIKDTANDVSKINPMSSDGRPTSPTDDFDARRQMQCANILRKLRHNIGKRIDPGGARKN